MVVGEPKRSIMEGIENTGDVRLHDHRLRLKQRFDIIRKLGQGTYGKVQLGINKKTGQEVAIKTIKKCKIETEADLVRIRREVQIMSSVRHPNIVHIYEVFENSEKMILVMEYCAGGELYDYLSQQKVLQEDEARRLFRQIATAVYYCHKHKICHRDLKLENVLLDEHGSAKIADFGLSNVFEERRLLATFCGSPLYASPEIVKGTPYIGPEVDCWSLGVLLYTLVYGAMPFDGSNFKRLVKQISTGDYFEPKTPSSASPLIRDMLTVDPIQRADITHICDNPWVNKGSDVSCLELAEALANETPVRLDLLLSLAPPPIHGSDKLLVTDEIKAAPSDSSPTRSMSLANIENSAERRILEMVAEGGTDAIKPSPTRTIVGAEQPKRKLEPAVSMDSAPSQRKKERTLRSSSKVNQAPNEPEPASMVAAEANEVENQEPVEQAAAVVKQETPSKAIKAEKEAISDAQPPQANNTTVVSPKQTPVKKESKVDKKAKDPATVKEKSTVAKPSAIVKKKAYSGAPKTDDRAKSTGAKEKSPPRKSMDKENSVRSASVENKAASEDTNGNDYASAPKQPTERRRSRILDAAEKLNNLSIQPGEAAGQLEKPKPKKVIIPDTISSAPNYLKKGVSVGSFKEQFERRASLTAANNTGNEVKKIPNKFTTPATMKSLADKKLHSLDSEHPPASVENKDPSSNVRLQTIGVEPSQPMKKEVPVAQPVEAKKPGPPESNRVTKPLHKSESLKEPSASRDNLQSSMSLEDARRSLQQSMALINQAKSDMAPGESSDDVSAQQQDRQSQLKTAREIISHAIGDDSNGKKVHRICMGGKPPVPYGSGGRSASGSISLGSLPGSPPVSPPGPLSPPLPPAMARPRDSPARTFRTEVQHRVGDVRNKFVPTSRGGSVERIIPIQFAEEAPKPQSHSGQLPYQRNNTMPYRLSSLPRGCISDNEVERTPPPQTPQSSVPSTPLSQSRAEPIKKSPREFIIPIAVEGVGYVTPRQGSLEPSETPSKLNPQGLGFASRFPKPRRISSLVSGGESEDEEDLHMHRLRSSRRTRAEPEKESVSSGEEDDDEGFELLTADNLFSTLLNRVCSLTNRLNGEEGTGFPQHHQSLFNNLHSPFFNSPHLPRKHKRHNIVRDGPSWRRSTSRDIASDFDSMFPNHPPFPRGSKKSSRRAASSKSGTSETSSNNQDTDNHSLPNDSDKNKHLFDLPDLDLSKMELSEKEVETLSGLTPALSRRLQKQLLAHLPPAAARSLRRTLSMNCPHMSDDRPSQHKYTRSLSANKTTLPEEDFNRNENIPIDSSNVNEDRPSQHKYTRSLSANKTTLPEEDFNKNGNVPIDCSNVSKDRASQRKYTRSLSANKTTLPEESFDENENMPINNCPNVSEDRTSQHKYTRSLSANKTTLPEESVDENENMPVNNCPNVSEDRASQHKYTKSLSANKTTLLEASVDKNENMPINCSNASEDRTSQHKYTRSLSDNKKTLPEETFYKNDNTSVNSSHASEDRSSQHKYTRSLSANRTTLPEESSDKSENLSSAADDSFLKTDLSGDNNNTHSKPVYEKYADDEDPSSISCASSKQENLIHSKADYSLPDLSDSSSLKNDRGRNGDATEDAYSAESITPRLLSSVRSTPDRSVLGKYFSDRPTLEDYSPLRSDYEGSSLLSEPSYLAAYGGSVSPLGSLRRRSLRTPPAETSKKRISRFLRPDFFDTPREESIYVREKKERELETQQVLKEIRQKERKKSRGLDPGSGLSSPLMSTDVTSLFDSANSRISSRNCLSPVSLTPRDRSRSITPFYPILDNINEVQNDYDSNRRIRETLMNIDKKVKQSNNNQGLQERNEYTMNNTSQQSESSNKGFDSVKESGGARPKSYSVESTNDNSFFKEEKKPSPDKASRGDSVVRESKLLRPKSYPSSSTSPEKHVTNIPVILTEPVASSQTCSNGNGEGNSRLIALDRNKSSSPMDRDSNGNITVSFNINLPSKTITKVQERVEEPTVKPPVEEKKKSPAKKKIIIKKKSASQKKVDAELQNGGETVKPANNVTPVKENKNGEQKVSPKRKSVLHSIGQKFEKFRNDSFSKSNSQEKEIPVEKPPKNVSEKEEPKLSRIENVMRALRERSVPPPSQAESITESSLIKRAVTVDDLPALDVKDTQNRTSVSRVLGLFKKNDSKDKTKCLENDTKEKNKSEDRGLSPEAEKEGAKVAQSEVSSSAAVPVDNKPKRPTSLLLNGIGKRVQACYSGATSDSVLVRGDKKPICKDDDPLVSNDSKDENKTSQKKGLRLDFSRLPILNQGLFNKRNSLDLSKQREGSESKESNEKAVNTSSENTTTGVMDAKVVKNGECNTEESHFRAESNNLSATPNGTDFSPSWSPDCDSYKHLSEAVDGNANQSLPQRFHEATSPDTENIEDRIRRKSFYSRFNEKKNQRRSTLVGPGAKEYIPSARIHPHTEVDRTLYSNKYDMSPTSSKYTASPLSLEHARLVHPLDKLECISPSTSRFKSYASDHKPGDKNDNRSSDSKFLDGNSYSIPRYTRTVSLFDNYDVRNNGNDTKAGNSRYGKSFSMMSPGSYATYSPRSHSRNSAILLRDSDDVKTDTESLLIKIRNRKKSAPANATFDEDVNLDSKIRSNHSPKTDNESPSSKTE